MRNARLGWLGGVVIALAAFAAVPKSAVKPSTHGQELSGTIASVDAHAKTFVIRDAAGKTTTVTWTAATRVEGGTLQPNERVTVRAMAKDGKTIATSVKVAARRH